MGFFACRCGKEVTGITWCLITADTGGKMKVTYIAAAKAPHRAGRLHPVRLAATQRLTGDFPTAHQGSRWPPPPRAHGPGKGPRPRRGPTACPEPRLPAPSPHGPGHRLLPGAPLFPGQPKTRFSPNRCAGREKAGKPPQISPLCDNLPPLPRGAKERARPGRTTTPSMLCGPAPPPSCEAEGRVGARSFSLP